MPASCRTLPLLLAGWAATIAAFVLIIAVGWPEAPLHAQEVYDEDSVKAAFIYHFSTFVVWPEPKRADRDFVIAVVGDDEIAAELTRYLPGHSIQGRPMQMRRLDSVADLSGEDVVFIGAGRNHALDADLAAIGNRSILIVTDADGALDKGSMINFRIVEQRVRFEISLPTAERAGLVLSSRLLAAAMLVDTTTALIDPPADAVVSGGPQPGRP
jgi:hypothetical protein